jgi:hypothetical protein
VNVPAIEAAQALALAVAKDRAAALATRNPCQEPGCDGVEGPHGDGLCRKHSKVSLRTKLAFEEQVAAELEVEGAGLVMKAARVAAGRGRVAQVREALEIGGLVDPKESAGQKGPGGVIVQIGITLPGLPGGATID